jgi:hypothetical protein
MVIVPVRIPFMSLPERQPAFVERVIPRREFTLPPDAARVAAAVREDLGGEVLTMPAESNAVVLGASW